MTAYTLHISPAALQELHDLDRPVCQRLIKKIRWLATNAATIRPDMLKGDLSGLFTNRAGKGLAPSRPTLGWAKPTAAGRFRKQARGFGLAAHPSPLRRSPSQEVNFNAAPLVSCAKAAIVSFTKESRKSTSS